MFLLKETSPQSLFHVGGMFRRWRAVSGSAFKRNKDTFSYHCRTNENSWVCTVWYLAFSFWVSSMCDEQESQYNNNNRFWLFSCFCKTCCAKQDIYNYQCDWIRPWLEGFRLTDRLSQLGYGWQGIHGPRSSPVAFCMSGTSPEVLTFPWSIAS